MMGINRLILLRHAKSDWYSDAATDFERPLNKRGRQDAPRVGQWLQSKDLVPSVICCSTACRTRETLKGVMRHLQADAADLHFLDELYHASGPAITGMVERFMPFRGDMLVVGHNPGVEMALLDYCPDLQVPTDGKLMPTATVAVIEFLSSGSPVMQHLVRPSDL